MTDIVPIKATGVRKVETDRVAGRKAQASAEPAAQRGADRVELSTVARMMSKLQANDIRTELVDRIKSEIADGKYATSEKLESAIDALIEDIS